jgi:Fe-Mn family superoxide dismutase
MSQSSRRKFLLTSSGALAGSIISPSLLHAKTQEQSKSGSLDYFAESGLVTGQKKPLPYESIPGFLSAEQIAPHFEGHYGGALKGYSAADDKLQNSIMNGETLDSSAYGALQRARTTKSNSVVLHELYFSGMGSSPCKSVDAEVKSAIEKRFGTVEKWAEDFKACAKAASGWALLAFHPVNGKLYNVISDAHATGVNWMATPLVVIDMYEHAYYIDYKNKKTDYIDKFMGHINCEEVNRRFKLA